MSITQTRVPESQRQPVANCAEALVVHLVSQGVEWIFLNPGTDTAPIQEAVVALARAGRTVPTIQVCPDERVAMAAAQGYWNRTGRPQAVVVHVDVGTQALGASLHNAQRTNSGVVVIAGTAPRTFDGSLPGGRTIAVHWQQDQLDQVGVVRNYVKWAEELTMVEALPHLVARAFQVARSAPAGPVYLTVAREVLMRPLEETVVPSPQRHRAPVTPPACRDAIAEAATVLAAAERPVLVTARAGRNLGSVAALDALSTKLGMPVVDAREYLNLPSSRPAYVEDDEVAADVLRAADVVLVVDAEVPWVPLNRRPRDDARVIQIDLDPVKQTMVNWAFAVDLPIQADSGKALWQLIEAVDALADDGLEARAAARLEQLRIDKDARAVARAGRVRELAGATPVTAETVVHELNRLLGSNAIVVEEVTTNDMLVREHLERADPGSIYAIGAAGLGWALGAAIGIKLAEPDREVVALTGDGTFQFSAPLAALWVAHDSQAPFLTVVLNNQGYRAAKFPVMGLFPDGASVSLDDFTGTVFGHPVDFAAVATACGAFGVVVHEPDQLSKALTQAREAVANGVCAVVDVRLEGI